jgi:putative glutamine amidotransferase
VSRPLVALTSYHEPAGWGVWRDVPAALLPWSYVRRISDAGGAPVLLPPVPDVATDVLARVDALLLTGGPDLDPARYGAEPHPATLPARPDRDAAELAALAVASRRSLPVLAICRGAQLLNVARGGTLHQHLPTHAPRTPGHYDSTEVRIAAGSRLAEALGTATTLLCHHHQGVATLGAGLTEVAWAGDGIVEGVEDPAARFVVGVQAHPEEAGRTAALFAAFVAAARGQFANGPPVEGPPAAGPRGEKPRSGPDLVS